MPERCLRGGRLNGRRRSVLIPRLGRRFRVSEFGIPARGSSGVKTLLPGGRLGLALALVELELAGVQNPPVGGTHREPGN